MAIFNVLYHVFHMAKYHKSKHLFVIECTLLTRRETGQRGRATEETNVYNIYNNKPYSKYAINKIVLQCLNYYNMDGYLFQIYRIRKVILTLLTWYMCWFGRFRFKKFEIYLFNGPKNSTICTDKNEMEVNNQVAWRHWIW